MAVYCPFDEFQPSHMLACEEINQRVQPVKVNPVSETKKMHLLER